MFYHEVFYNNCRLYLDFNKIESSIDLGWFIDVEINKQPISKSSVCSSKLHATDESLTELIWNHA